MYKLLQATQFRNHQNHKLNLCLRHGPLLPLLGDVLGAERHLVRDLAPPRLALLVTPQLE